MPPFNVTVDELFSRSSIIVYVPEPNESVPVLEDPTEVAPVIVIVYVPEFDVNVPPLTIIPPLVDVGPVPYNVYVPGFTVILPPVTIIA